MALSKHDFDYAPLGRGLSFALLLLVLFSISTSLRLLVDIVGVDQRPSKSDALTPSSPRSSQGSLQVPAGAPACHAEDTHQLKFSQDAEWQGWNANVTENWASMLPPNNGLGQDDAFNDGIPYGVAMFHQIHCLQAIRAHYTALLLNGEDADFARTPSQKGHIGHCFNWVRQAILCHADDTRELQVYNPQGQLIDNTTRVCGNIATLYAQTKNPKAIKANIDAAAGIS